jgi:hypothetical protein
MTEKKANALDLKMLEKKAFKSTFEDGIWDIYFGILIFGLGLSPLGTLFGLNSTISMIIILPLVYIFDITLLILGKRKITIPRMGHVKFGPKRQKRKKELVLFLSLIVIINLIIFLLSTFDIIEFGWLPVLNILMIALPISIVAYLLDFRRLYAYGLLIGVSIYASIELEWLLGFPLTPIIFFGIAGLVMIICGIYFLINFLRKYPSQSEYS